MMGNCHKLFINNRLFGVFKTELNAEYVLKLIQETYEVETYKIELAYIENIGF